MTPEELEEITLSARKAFGHVSGRTDTECLALRVSQLTRLAKGRLGIINSVRDWNCYVTNRLPPDAKFAGLPMTNRALDVESILKTVEE